MGCLPFQRLKHRVSCARFSCINVKLHVCIIIWCPIIHGPRFVLPARVTYRRVVFGQAFLSHVQSRIIHGVFSFFSLRHAQG